MRYAQAQPSLHRPALNFPKEQGRREIAPGHLPGRCSVRLRFYGGSRSSGQNVSASPTAIAGVIPSSEPPGRQKSYHAT